MTKHLSRLGWQVTVATPEVSVLSYLADDEGLEQRLAAEGIQRILTGHRRRYLTADPHWNRGLGWFAGGITRRIARTLSIDQTGGWLPAAQKAIRARLGPGDVDVILATAPPVTSFRLAARLASWFGCPYVLDYRDPWTGNPHNPRDDAKAQRQEGALLSRAAAVTIVSPSWADSLTCRFPVASKTHVVTNGYDPEELDSLTPTDFGHFAIVYTGRFYPPKRTVIPLMAALKVLDQMPEIRSVEWRFHYYGRHGEHVRQAALRHDVLHRVVFHDMVPWVEAASAIRGAGVSVVISTVEADVGPAEAGIVPAKVFEALGCRVPVLAVGPPESDIARILAESGGGSIFRGSQVEEMARYLAELISGRKSGLCEARQWCWPRLAKQFHNILTSAAEPGRDLKATVGSVRGGYANAQTR